MLVKKRFLKWNKLQDLKYAMQILVKMIYGQSYAENIKRGGEWIETRLLTSGPRTNPWFQECGPEDCTK